MEFVFDKEMEGVLSNLAGEHSARLGMGNGGYALKWL